MRRISVILITLTLIFGLAISSHAILIDRGGGMIYSTDLKRKGSSLLLTLGNVGGHFPNTFF